MAKIKIMKSIKNLRNIKSFSSDKEFSINNVIYSDNGLGKTNISRLFYQYSIDNRSKGFEDKELNPLENSEKLKFEINMENDSEATIKLTHKDDSISQDILVYNSDYIDQNIRIGIDKWKGSKAKIEVVELGKEQIELGKKIKEKEAIDSSIKVLLENLKVKLNKYVKNLKDKGYDKGIQKYKAEYFLNLENLTNISNYEEYKKDKNTVDEKDKNEWKDAETNFEKLNIKDENIIEKINTINIPEQEEFLNLLTKSKQFDEIDSDTEKQINKLSREFIQEGYDLYKKDPKFNNNCPLCLNKFGETQERLFKKYGEFLSSEKGKFEKEVKDKVEDINNLINSVSKIIALIDPTYKQITERYKIFGDKINNETKEKVQKILDKRLASKDVKLIQDLNHKIKNPDKKFAYKKIDIIEFASKVNEVVTELNNLIEQINGKQNERTKRKGDLRQIIFKKAFLLFYEANESEIKALEQNQKDYALLEEKIKVLRSSIGDSVVNRIPDLFNEMLDVVGLRKYRLELEGDDRLSLKLLTDNPSNKQDFSGNANRISEGEKSVISLCYFFASSINSLTNHKKFKNSIFIIDDPIASTDYKYFYGIASLIDKFRNIISKEFNSGLAKPQVIISTHNYKLYNSMRNSFWKNACHKKKAKFFIFLTKDGQNFELSEGGEKLSEYENSINRVMEWNKTSKDMVVNDIRKILELHCELYNKNLCSDDIKAIFDLDEKKNEKFFRLIQSMCHADIDGVTDELPPKEYEDAVEEFQGILGEKIGWKKK